MTIEPSRRHSTRAPGRVLLALLAALAVLGAACAQGSPAISVANARTPEPAMADLAAVYLDLANDGDGDDALVAAETDHAADVELHETVVEDGVATMGEIEEIPVPAGETVELTTGGLHLMLIDPEPLAPGDAFDLTLELAESGTMDVEVEVVDAAEAGGHNGADHGDHDDEGHDADED